jgi:hypothetical protein
MEHKGNQCYIIRHPTEVNVIELNISEFNVIFNGIPLSSILLNETSAKGIPLSLMLLNGTSVKSMLY